MLPHQEQINLFLNRCGELTSKETMPSLLVPLVTPQNIASFLLDALKAAYAPYADGKYDRGAGSLARGPLAFIHKPADLLSLTAAQLSVLHRDFSKTLTYVKNYLSACSLADIEAKVIPLNDDNVIELAEAVIRYLISLGFHPSYLNAYFSSFWPSSTDPDILATITELFSHFQPKHEHQIYSVYTPRLIGRGGEDRGFKSVSWEKLPAPVQNALIRYLAEELGIKPNERSQPSDQAYQQRYRKWELETETLTLSKYLAAEVISCDPFSAAEEFREQYSLMKHVVYISRKSTGASSHKSIHYTHRNTGRRAVQLQDVSVIIGGQDRVDQEPILVHLDKPSFPYQKLKNEFPRQRELLELFYDKCVVFRQLMKSYSNALEAFSNGDIEDIFRNLAVATELAFAKDNVPEPNAKRLLLHEGARLLALDWLRDEFQSLTFLAKRCSPGKSEERDRFQIHLNIIEDEKWKALSTRIRIPSILTWRRQRLMAIINNSGTDLDNLCGRFEAELTILWYARHQFAHRANVFREGYFIALLLNLFRIALDYRFSCYAIWLEWHSNQRIEGGLDGPSWDAYKNNFVDGWKEEFSARVQHITPEFDGIRQNARFMIKQLVLGAGYVGLGVHPKRNIPARPLTIQS